MLSGTSGRPSTASVAPPTASPRILRCTIEDSVEQEPEEQYAHVVFQRDPRPQRAQLGKFVRVRVHAPVQAERATDGFFRALDPVSQSVLLAVPTDGGFCYKLYPGDSVQEVMELEAPPGTKTTQCEFAPELSAELLAEKRSKVISWLSKNLLSVRVKDEVIDVHDGSLSIYPPYESTNCVTDNAIVLARMQHLLKNVPDI